MATTESMQLQVRFVTKQDRFSVPDNPFALPAQVTPSELNDLLNQLLDSGARTEFDFIAGGELVRSSLGEHFKKRGVSLEATVEVEYLERHPAPEALDCLVHDDWVSSISASSTAILSGCYDGAVHVWTTSGDHKLALPGHSAAIKAVEWIDSDGATATFVSGSQDQTCRIWKWNLGDDSVRCTDLCVGHSRSIECLAVSPAKSHFATGSWDKFLKIWSLGGDDDESEQKRAKKSDDSSTVSRGPQVTLKGHKESISGVKWLNNVELATCSWDHTVRIWDTEMNSSLREIGGNKSFFAIDHSEVNGLLATASADRHIRLYDPRSDEGHLVKMTLTSHRQWVSSVSWSRDREHLLVSGSYDHSVKLWDIRSPQVPLYDLVGHDDRVLCTNWSLTALIASGGADNTLRLFKSLSPLK